MISKKISLSIMHHESLFNLMIAHFAPIFMYKQEPCIAATLLHKLKLLFIYVYQFKKIITKINGTNNT